MKRWAIPFILLLVCGCAQTAQSSSSQAQPEFSTTTVVGKVRTVTGNEVLLDLAKSGGAPSEQGEAPKGAERQPPGEISGAAPGGNAAGQNRQNRTGNTSRAAGEGGWSGTTTGRAAGAGGNASRAQGQSGTLTYTGEQATYLIPVGTPVITTSNVKVDFNSMSVGTVVTLTLRDAENGPVVIQVDMMG